MIARICPILIKSQETGPSAALVAGMRKADHERVGGQSALRLVAGELCA